MGQRDYILRQIEQLGSAYGALIRSAEERKGLQYRAVGETVDQTLRQHFGLSMATAKERSAEELIGLVRMGASVYAGDGTVGDRLTLLAAILREQADADAAGSDIEEAAIGRLKALQIFLTVLVEEDVASDFASSAVEPLLEVLASYELPPTVKELLWRYAEQSGDFAQAEDWLFALVEEDPGALEQGIAFYERLTHFTDNELAQGNLPRAEVASSLAELRARRTSQG
jgi:hypothetical protein